MTTLRIVRLPHAVDLPLPACATEGAAGLDLRAAFCEPAPCEYPGAAGKVYPLLAYNSDGSPGAPVWLSPGDRLLIPTGFTMAIPPGFEGQIRPRSGLALRDGLTVLNAPGTIDSDFRGEVKVLLVNLGSEPATIKRGDRIAQLVIAPVATCQIEEVEDLGETVRGDGGFGSTGTK